MGALLIIAGLGSLLRGADPAPAEDVVAEAKAAVARASDPQAIRSVDVRSLLASPLGWPSMSEVAYADLTGDGKEEVVVSLATGGSAGDRAIAVYGYDANGFLHPLLIRQSDVGHLQAHIEMGKLEIREPRYAPGEPNCCPGEMTFTLYRWNGKQLVEAKRRVEKIKK